MTKHPWLPPSRATHPCRPCPRRSSCHGPCLVVSPPPWTPHRHPPPPPPLQSSWFISFLPRVLGHLQAGALGWCPRLPWLVASPALGQACGVVLQLCCLCSLLRAAECPSFVPGIWVPGRSVFFLQVSSVSRLWEALALPAPTLLLSSSIFRAGGLSPSYPGISLRA